MKITKSQLQRILKEEIKASLMKEGPEDIIRFWQRLFGRGAAEESTEAAARRGARSAARTTRPSGTQAGRGSTPDIAADITSADLPTPAELEFDPGMPGMRSIWRMSPHSIRNPFGSQMVDARGRPFVEYRANAPLQTLVDQHARNPELARELDRIYPRDAILRDPNLGRIRAEEFHYNDWTSPFMGERQRDFDSLGYQSRIGRDAHEELQGNFEARLQRERESHEAMRPSQTAAEERVYNPPYRAPIPPELRPLFDPIGGGRSTSPDIDAQIQQGLSSTRAPAAASAQRTGATSRIQQMIDDEPAPLDIGPAIELEPKEIEALERFQMLELDEHLIRRLTNAVMESLRRENGRRK